MAERAFSRIDIFEQRSTVGGVWNYTPDLADKPAVSIPQTSPFAPVEEPIWHFSGDDGVFDKSGRKQAFFVSPLYDRLETNIPHSLMQFSDLPFPDGTQLFPKHETVTKYLETYAEDVRHLIKFQTQVLDVRLGQSQGTEKWMIKRRDLLSGEASESEYDAVVVASGHYNVPFIPDITRIAEWNKAYPGSLSHSKFYRNLEKYRDRKVIVVGNSASGLDIGAQISTVCKHPLLVSQKSESYLSSGSQSYKEELPEIAEFMIPDRAVRFVNGRIEKDIDTIVFCTGYFYSFPFLSSLNPPVISDGTRTQNVYKHIFYNQHPTLAFIALPQKIIPFPISEVQASIIARVWSNHLELPSLSAMQQWEEELISQRGAGKGFHTLMFPLDADYINELHDWAMGAERMSGPENDGRGKEPPYWAGKERWVRQRFPAIKKAFQDKGEERHQIRSIEELGVDFERWKMENEGARKLL